MSAPPDLAFVACIEKGVLERQALLLFESIRAYAGGFADCPIYALAPRAGLGVGRATRRRLEALRVEYIDTVLNTECVEYGSTNRVVAAAHVEATTPHEILVVLDSDTLLLREPEAFRLAPDVDVAVRPVDNKGICTTGPRDPYDAYWRALCEICGVAYDEIPWIRSYVDDVRVKASYNGGLVVVRRDRGILRRWSECFLASVRAGLRPSAEALAFRSSTGAVAAPASRMWGSNQAALALAMWSTTRRVLTLDPTYNYPLHAHADLRERRARDFDRLVHVHYHWLFEPDAIADAWITAPASTLAADKLAWLRARTPFQAVEAPVTRERSHRTASSSEGRAVAQPVLVAGMHRSGTSLTASILGSAGLHIGDDLVPPAPGNIEGHFEDREFVELHRTALQRLGHDPEGWDEVLLDAMPGDLEAWAQDLIDARAALPLWGWKDPRTTLFLPFWERLLPEARFVFVYRKPWEVIDSLYRRGDARFRRDPAAAARLWSHYNSAILESCARMPERALLFSLEDIAARPSDFVEHVGRTFGLHLDPPADLFKPELLRRGGSLADWRALSESILSPAIEILKRLDATAHRLTGDASPAEPAVPPAPEGALLRQWAALRAAERVCDEIRVSEAARPAEPLCLYIPSQGVYSEVTTLVDVLAADGETRDYMFLVDYDGSAPLRLDVGASVGMAELEAVTVRSRETGVAISWSGRALDAAPFRLVHAIRTGGRRDDTFCFLSLNEDSQLYVELPDTPRFQGACQIDITVGFRAMTEGPVPRAAAAILREMTAVTKASAVLRSRLADAAGSQREAAVRQHEIAIREHAATIDDLRRRLADADVALGSRQSTLDALEGRLLQADDRWQNASARLESNEATLAELREAVARRSVELDSLREALAKSESRLSDLSGTFEALRQSRAYRFGRLLFDPLRRDASVVVPPELRANGSRAVSYSDLACLAQTPLFDAAFYLASNPDVRAAHLEPRMHYLCRGAAEGRNPSPWFDTAFYLAQYPDVAGAGMNPLVHYVTCGVHEGRLPKPRVDAVPGVRPG